MKFEELKIIEPILKALKNEGYEQATPIQEQAIPMLLEGRDLLGCAQTGTGKTCAFAVPILQKLQTKKCQPRVIRALILTPTRELAAQIYDNFVSYGKYIPLKSVVIFGGVKQKHQEEKLSNGCDILIATPGRLNDLMEQGIIHINKVEMFVLDEADRMLDMGFINDVKKIAAKTPKQKQTLLFSATMPKEIQKFADSLLVNPAHVAVSPVSSTTELVKQQLYYVEKSKKKNLLLYLLQNPDLQSVLVFTRTKHLANRVVKDLISNGVHAMAIHGNKSQNQRIEALAAFKKGKIRVLVATDIAARGIDIDELSHVINYDLPNISETYVHRIGRTGRAGASGVAISFCDDEERAYLRDILKLIKRDIEIIEDKNYLKVKMVKEAKPEVREAKTNTPKKPHRIKASDKINDIIKEEIEKANRPVRVKPIKTDVNFSGQKVVKKKKSWFNKTNDNRKKG